MNIYRYEAAFGAADITSRAMKAAIEDWYELYYRSATDENTDPAFLAEDLRILSNHLTTKQPLRIWLICPPGAPQEQACRHAAQQFDSVRMVAPDRLSEEVRAFAEEL